MTETFVFCFSGEMKIVICDTEDKVKSLLKEKNNTPCLKHVIVMQNVTDELKKAAKDKDVELHSFKDIIVRSLSI